jgi:hypothetical protein
MNPWWLQDVTAMSWAVIFLALVIGHALGDFPLQSEFMVRGKSRALKQDPSLPPSLWLYCLVAHALIHGGLVWLLTGQVVLGVIEIVLHTLIDGLKIFHKLNFHSDQALHVMCKLGYAVALTQGWGGIGG